MQTPVCFRDDCGYVFSASAEFVPLTPCWHQQLVRFFRIHRCHPADRHSAYKFALMHSLKLQFPQKYSVYFLTWRDPAFRGWNPITTAGRCCSQMAVTVCLDQNNHTEDGGNVYWVTRLCTVPCQTQDMEVRIVTKTTYKSETHDANHMLSPRISKQILLVYLQHF